MLQLGGCGCSVSSSCLRQNFWRSVCAIRKDLFLRWALKFMGTQYNLSKLKRGFNQMFNHISIDVHIINQMHRQNRFSDDILRRLMTDTAFSLDWFAMAERERLNFDRRYDIIILNRLSTMRKTASDNQQMSRAKNYKTSKLLDVYIRNNNKQALLLHTPHIANLNHIQQAISTRFRVPPEHQALFHNGRHIEHSYRNRQIELTDKAVIHLVDKRNIHREITINVRRLNLPTIQQFRIPSSQVIEDFIVRSIQDQEPQKLFFVYTGRQLRKDRSFEEQFVENNSELFCLHEERDEVKGDRRKYYQRKMHEQSGKNQREVKQQKVQQRQQDEGDNVLVNYLPKERQSEQPSKDLQNREVQPNFKKKNATKQINLSGNLQPLRKFHLAEGNLSVINQNFQQSHSALGNSNYFNQGSSISEIIPDYAHNPESSKRLQQGSMFQSAFMGFNNEPSQMNSRAGEADIPEEQEIDGSKERQSFDFDVRAPELLQPPNKHLTLLEREILEVTESQQLSQENTNRQQNEESEGNCLSPQQRNNKQQQSAEHSQFELGEIENHLLSASTELKVQDPNSPIANSKSKSRNEILIEQEDQQEPSVNNLERLNAENEQLEYIGVEINPISQQSSEKESNLEFPEKDVGKKDSYDLESKREQVEIYAQKQKESPFFENTASQQQLDIFIIQQGNPESGTSNGVSQIVEEKQEVETHGPSSSSNFYSKTSSRVKQFCPAANEYEFGHYNKPTNKPTTQSGCYQTHYDHEQNQIYADKSLKNDKSNSLVHPSKKQNQDQRHDDSEDLELQIVDLPIEIKIQEHAQSLLNYESQLVLKSKVERLCEEQERKEKKREQPLKQGSRIDELNVLLEEQPDQAQLLEQPVEEEKDSNLLSQQSSVEKAESSIQIDTSLNNRYQPNEISETLNNSHESLEQVRLKKTIAGLSSAAKLQSCLKATPHKQHLSQGHYIFKSQPNHFDALQFYINLLQNESILLNNQQS